MSDICVVVPLTMCSGCANVTFWHTFARSHLGVVCQCCMHLALRVRELLVLRLNNGGTYGTTTCRQLTTTTILHAARKCVHTQAACNRQ
mmetsp:Transcript_22753/g.62508  ORF Transcript_22753/g.62508 Transcript_22753/m.62508 type:complete len:89 (+) Transcript_22753:708-974(+)